MCFGVRGLLHLKGDISQLSLFFIFLRTSSIDTCIAAFISKVVAERLQAFDLWDRREVSG
jgi:hypothetical protein